MITSTPRTDTALSRADIAPDYGLSTNPISGWQLSEIVPLMRAMEGELAAQAATIAQLKAALQGLVDAIDPIPNRQAHLILEPYFVEPVAAARNALKVQS